MYRTGNHSVFCVALKWEGNSDKRGYACVHVADSLSCTVATHNIIKQLYSNKKLFFKRKEQILEINLITDSHLCGWKDNAHPKSIVGDHSGCWYVQGASGASPRWTL